MNCQSWQGWTTSRGGERRAVNRCSWCMRSRPCALKNSQLTETMTVGITSVVLASSLAHHVAFYTSFKPSHSPAWDVDFEDSRISGQIGSRRPVCLGGSVTTCQSEPRWKVCCCQFVFCMYMCSFCFIYQVHLCHEKNSRDIVSLGCPTSWY